MNPLPIALAAVLTSTAVPAGDPAVTIYRSDSDELFGAGTQAVAEGHAVIHEQRATTLGSGRQNLTIGGLPALLDSEAINIDFGAAARVLGQRVIAPGAAGLLEAHRGQRVVVSDGGQNELASGELVAVDGERIAIRAADGRIAYLQDYARIDFPEGTGLPGSTLQVALDVSGAGSQTATLDYPTSGLGWRAAYAVHLDERGNSCRMRLDALASIANRSGRGYDGATLKLVAGAPNLERGFQPMPRMAMKAMAAPAPAPEAMPEQSALGDYRSYLIDGAIDLPDASVTQVPLYASRELDCTRRWLASFGYAWFPDRPQLNPGNDAASKQVVSSQLSFNAPENLPAGRVRVLTRDRDGRNELLGEARSSDTAKGRTLDLVLGTAFSLHASRERSAFTVDRAARTMDESFRVTLENAGENSTTLTVREHPNRWRVWELASSSQKPARKTADQLEFEVAVPAHGKVTLDYRLRYRWTAADE